MPEGYVLVIVGEVGHELYAPVDPVMIETV